MKQLSTLLRTALAAASFCALPGFALAQNAVPIGTGTALNSEFDYPTPFGDYYEGSRQQFLYRASELQAAGLTAGNITGIRWVVGDVYFSDVHENYTIKIGATTNTALTATGWISGLSTVYGPNNYSPVQGNNNFTFSTPFSWDGYSNIVVEVCHGTSVVDPNVDDYTENAGVAYTTLSFRGSRAYYEDDAGISLCSYTGTDTSDQQAFLRPNITFLSSASVCAAPQNLAVSGITGNGATFNWDAVTGATGYEYAITQSATPPTTAGTSVTGTTFTATSLSGTTAYYFWLRARCSATSASSWTSINFTTTAAASCLAPATLTVTNTSATDVSLSWTAASGATSYQYAVNTSATPPASGASVTATTANVGSLTGGTTYYAHVRTACGNTFSPWRTETFVKSTTSVAGPAGAGFGWMVSPNPATTTLTVALDARAGSDGRFQLLDLAGRVVLAQPATGAETTLDLQRVPAGLYMLRYTGGEHTLTTRVQKL